VWSDVGRQFLYRPAPAPSYPGTDRDYTA
jgi:hypothetical protein